MMTRKKIKMGLFISRKKLKGILVPRKEIKGDLVPSFQDAEKLKGQISFRISRRNLTGISFKREN